MDINLLIDDQDLAASDGRTFERCDRVTGAVADAPLRRLLLMRSSAWSRRWT